MARKRLFLSAKPRYLSGSRWLYNKDNLKTSGVILLYDLLNSPTAIFRGGFFMEKIMTRFRHFWLFILTFGLSGKAEAAGCAANQAKSFKNPQLCVACNGANQTRQDGFCYEIKCKKGQIVALGGGGPVCQSGCGTIVKIDTSDKTEIVFAVTESKSKYPVVAAAPKNTPYGA